MDFTRTDCAIVRCILPRRRAGWNGNADSISILNPKTYEGLENLNALRQKLVAPTDRLAGFESELLNVHIDFPLFQRLALPIPFGRTKIPCIKIHDIG